jgi:hypothetical protein
MVELIDTALQPPQCNTTTCQTREAMCPRKLQWGRKARQNSLAGTRNHLPRSEKDILHLNICKHARKDLMPLHHHAPPAALCAVVYIFRSVGAGSVAVPAYYLAGYLELVWSAGRLCDLAPWASVGVWEAAGRQLIS